MTAGLSLSSQSEPTWKLILKGSWAGLLAAYDACRLIGGMYAIYDLLGKTWLSGKPLGIAEVMMALVVWAAVLIFCFLCSLLFSLLGGGFLAWIMLGKSRKGTLLKKQAVGAGILAGALTGILIVALPVMTGGLRVTLGDKVVILTEGVILLGACAVICISSIYGGITGNKLLKDLPWDSRDKPAGDLQSQAHPIAG